MSIGLNELKNVNKAIASGNHKYLIEFLNRLLISDDYIKNMELIYMIISSSQLYGFLSYLKPSEIDDFFKSDFFRAASYSGNEIKYYNSGQLSFLDELDDHKKVFFSAATSFGKTSLVIEYIINKHKSFNNIVFVVPTNSLLEELYVKFNKINKRLSLEYNVTTQLKINGEKNIFFLTPEKFLIFIEDKIEEILDLIVMDEAYKILDFRSESISDIINDRSLRFRKVADIIAKMDSKVLFLSPYTYKVSGSMEKFFEINLIKKIDREMEYVSRNIVDLSNSEMYKQYFETNEAGYQKSLSIAKKCSYIIPKLKDDKNIIYVSTYSDAYKIVNELNVKIEVKEEIDAKIVDRYKKFMEHLKLKFDVEGIPKWQMISALEKGVGIYFSAIPRYIKKEIIYLFENNMINTLIVTTSFTEGVNTNAQNLIFTSLFTARNVRLSNIDILNVAGRAGRFAKSPIGRILCLNKDVYSEIISLKKEANILLENYNYVSDQNELIDFEFEMMDDQFLLQEYINKKKELRDEFKKLGLTNADFKVSLNVSNKWKLHLYKKLFRIKESSLIKLFQHFKILITSEEKNKVKSLNIIFKLLKNLFKDFETEIFPYKRGEIPPFSRSGNFTWGALYKIYTQGSNKKIISSNLNYIKQKFNSKISEIPQHYRFKDKISSHFEYHNLKWVLDKYYRYDNNNKEFLIQYNSFYTETFRFISNIIQYKIPFYLSFFISIFKIFIKKEKAELILDIDEIDVKVLVAYFEDGMLNEEYISMVDFGLPNEIINLVKENKISFSDIISEKYNKEIFDTYENLLLEEFIDFTR